MAKPLEQEAIEPSHKTRRILRLTALGQNGLVKEQPDQVVEGLRDSLRGSVTIGAKNAPTGQIGFRHQRLDERMVRVELQDRFSLGRLLACGL